MFSAGTGARQGQEFADSKSVQAQAKSHIVYSHEIKGFEIHTPKILEVSLRSSYGTIVPVPTGGGALS